MEDTNDSVFSGLQSPLLKTQGDVKKAKHTTIKVLFLLDKSTWVMKQFHPEKYEDFILDLESSFSPVLDQYPPNTRIIQFFEPSPDVIAGNWKQLTEKDFSTKIQLCRIVIQGKDIPADGQDSLAWRNTFSLNVQNGLKRSNVVKLRRERVVFESTKQLKENIIPKIEKLEISVHRVLNQVHHDIGISIKGMQVTCDILLELAHRIMKESYFLCKELETKTITAREIQTAIRLIYVGELGKHGVSEGVKAVTKFSYSEGEMVMKTRAEKSGCQFPVVEVYKFMCLCHKAPKVGMSAAVYLSASKPILFSFLQLNLGLEYMCAEIMELSGNAARDNRKSKIIPRHILLAIANDEELVKTIPERYIRAGGVMPHIHSVILPRFQNPGNNNNNIHNNVVFPIILQQPTVVPTPPEIQMTIGPKLKIEGNDDEEKKTSPKGKREIKTWKTTEIVTIVDVEVEDSSEEESDDQSPEKLVPVNTFVTPTAKKNPNPDPITTIHSIQLNDEDPNVVDLHGKDLMGGFDFHGTEMTEIVVDGEIGQSNESEDESEDEQKDDNVDSHPHYKSSRHQAHDRKYAKEIRRNQKSTRLLIPKAPFHRLVLEIARKSTIIENVRLSKKTAEVLQLAAESYLVELFEHANLSAIHRRSCQIAVKDIRLSLEIVKVLEERRRNINKFFQI